MNAETKSTFKLHWYITVALALLVFAVVGAYSMSMAVHTTGYDEEQGRQRLQKLEMMRDQERKTLDTADWIDKGKGVVRIPIDEAMTQEVALLKNDLPRAGAALPGSAAPVTASAPAQPANATPPPPPPAAQGGTNPQPTK